MNTTSKSTQKNPNNHLTVGTLLTDGRIEIFADKNTGRVFFKQNGNTYPFSKLPKDYKTELTLKLFKDGPAVNQLNTQFRSLDQMLEQFAFCSHGDVDNHPDIVDGLPSKSENFRCKPGLECQCLKWQSKAIRIDGKKLSMHQLELTLAIATGLPDKAICQIMTNPIAQSTLDTRKRNLYAFANVQCKGEFIKKVILQKIIQ